MEENGNGNGNIEEVGWKQCMNIYTDRCVMSQSVKTFQQIENLKYLDSQIIFPIPSRELTTHDVCLYPKK